MSETRTDVGDRNDDATRWLSACRLGGSRGCYLAAERTTELWLSAIREVPAAHAKNVVGEVKARIRTSREDLVLLTYFPLVGGATTFYHGPPHCYGISLELKNLLGPGFQQAVVKMSLIPREQFGCGERDKKASTFLSLLPLINILMLIIPKGLDTANSGTQMSPRTECSGAGEIAEARTPRWTVDTPAHPDKGLWWPRSGY